MIDNKCSNCGVEIREREPWLPASPNRIKHPSDFVCINRLVAERNELKLRMQMPADMVDILRGLHAMVSVIDPESFVAFQLRDILAWTDNQRQNL